MFRSVRWLSLLLACVVSPLAAQQNIPPSKSAQPPNSNFNQNDPNQAIFGHVNQTAWFMEPSVRAQLQINEQQAARLNQSYAQFWKVYNRNQPQFSNNTSPTPQQQQAMIDASNRFYSDFNRSANDILEARQRARFYQLGFQYRGYGVFWDPVYTERLRLTNDQIQTLKRYEQDYDRELRIAMRNRDTYPRRLSDLRTELNERINSTLTDDQRKVWKEYYGEPFAFKVQ